LDAFDGCIRSTYRPLTTSSSALNGDKLIPDNMGRNLYILAASLTLFALISCGVAYTNIAQQPGSPGDTALWRTMGLVLFLIALVVALAGILSSLFEQAERHTDEARRRKRP
jgi:uncharacterized iron-regulated membrane protein